MGELEIAQFGVVDSRGEVNDDVIKLGCELCRGGAEVDQIVVGKVGEFGGSRLASEKPDARCCEGEAVVGEGLPSVEVLDCRSWFCSQRNVGGRATEIGVDEKDA